MHVTGPGSLETWDRQQACGPWDRAADAKVQAHVAAGLTSYVRLARPPGGNREGVGLRLSLTAIGGRISSSSGSGEGPQSFLLTPLTDWLRPTHVRLLYSESPDLNVNCI